MFRFQYTLRELFWATTVIAIGCPGLAWAINSRSDPIARLGIGFVSISVMGAGIGIPLHNSTAGIFIAWGIFLVLGLVRALQVSS